MKLMVHFRWTVKVIESDEILIKPIPLEIHCREGVARLWMTWMSWGWETEWASFSVSLESTEYNIGQKQRMVNRRLTRESRGGSVEAAKHWPTTNSRKDGHTGFRNAQLSAFLPRLSPDDQPTHHPGRPDCLVFPSPALSTSGARCLFLYLLQQTVPVFKEYLHLVIVFFTRLQERNAF
jgi:hypothetical protein